MAQLLQDDEADTSSDASSLYDEIDPSALAQLAANNASARTQFLALLDKCAAAERDAAAAQDAIAAMASSVAEVGTAHAPAFAIAQTASKRGAAHARTADAIAAAAAVCAAMTGDEPTLDANDAEAAVDAARRRLRGRGAKHEDRRVALRDAYRQRDASREAAARACHRIDAKRARAVAAAVTALQRAERAHLAERLSAVVAADDHTATARAKRRAFAATRSSAAGARRHDAALRVLDWCDARRAERRDDVAQAPPAKAAQAVEALFDAASKRTATEEDVAAASTVYGRARRDTLAAIGAHRSTPSVESPLVAECLARLFANAVDAKDARDAAQAMALAATFCAAGASTPLVEGAVFRDAARAAISRIGSDAFWDEQLLTGAESELRLTRLFQEGAWDRGQETRDVDDAVDHVQTVLFNRLVATAHSMRLLGEDLEAVRRFADRSARLYQLPRARRHAARETLLS